MYRFVCPNGHISRSASRDQGACGHSMCDMPCFRVVAADELVRANVDDADCVRDVTAAGDTYALHGTLGIAYTELAMKMANDIRRERAGVISPIPAQRYLAEYVEVNYGSSLRVMAQ